MKDLILLPAPRKSTEDSTNHPGEIFIDPSERRGARRHNSRRPGAILFLALITAASAYSLYCALDAPKAEWTTKANEAAQIDKTQQQISALQTEVRELRAKLDAAEKRQPAEPAAPAPAAEAKAATGDTAAMASTAKEPVGEAAPIAPAKSAAAEPPPVQSVAPTPKTVGGYRLREVSHGVAILETRRGVVAVRTGDVLADAGHVNAIQKRAGRWVVSTESGEIVGEAQARPPAQRRRPVVREQYGYAPERFLPSLFIPF